MAFDEITRNDELLYVTSWPFKHVLLPIQDEVDTSRFE